MYKNFPNEQEKKRIFFDNPKVFLKGRYIQPKGKSIGEKISHRSGRAGRVRNRFKIAKNNISFASKIITETLERGFIKPSDPKNASKKYASYIPFWA